jgi:hypothetical protein
MGSGEAIPSEPPVARSQIPVGKERAAQRSDDVPNAASWPWTCCSLDLQSRKLAGFNVGLRAKDALFDCE